MLFWRAEAKKQSVMPSAIIHQACKALSLVCGGRREKTGKRGLLLVCVLEGLLLCYC
jgi:hypothetical protein